MNSVKPPTSEMTSIVSGGALNSTHSLTGLGGGFRRGPSRLRPPSLGRGTDAVTHGHVS